MYFQTKMPYVRVATIFGAIACSAALGGTPPAPEVVLPSMLAPGATPASLAEGALERNQKDPLPTPSPSAVGDGAALQALSRSINPLWVVPVTSFSAVRDRPVFSRSRRPSSIVPQSELPVSPSVGPALVLVGVVAGEDSGIGIFMNEGTTDIVRLKTGQSYSGWILSEVKKREATLRRGGEVAIIEIPNP
jgi:hypothetical protein